MEENGWSQICERGTEKKMMTSGCGLWVRVPPESPSGAPPVCRINMSHSRKALKGLSQQMLLKARLNKRKNKSTLKGRKY